MKQSTLTAFIAFLISLILSAGLFPAPAAAGEVRLLCHFEDPVIKDTGNGFQRIFFPGVIQAGKPGEPEFPFRGVRLLLPEGEEAISSKIVRRGWRQIAGSIRLHPKQHVRPGSEPVDDSRNGGLLFRQEAYEIDRMADPADSGFRTHFLRGHAIATGCFSPVSFNPVTSEAGWYSEVEIIIETSPGAEAAKASRFIRRDKITTDRLSSLVDNPDAVCPTDAGHGSIAAGTGYDYLIISRTSMAGEFTPLRDFYEKRGIRTRIMTVEDIDAGWPGSDSAERVRSAVIDQYVTEGIGYLLLAGDGDPGGVASVPFRGLYCAVQSGSLYENDNIPSDIYFACLDGDWNTDSDTLWGEPGEDDLYQEISVGRAPVDSPAEAASFINKVVMYQEAPVTGDLEKALLLGEHLYSDPLTWGGDEMDQLVGECTLHGFTTSGIPEAFDITRYYDRDLGTWSSPSLYAAVNAGTAWLSHAGHSNTYYAMRISAGDVNTSNFTNDGISANFPVVYTYGCYAGAFDADDCICETMVTIDTYASALLCHSRYGWFTEGTTNGPSHHFQREFFDAIFTEDVSLLGDALGRAKDETAPFVDLPDEYEPGAHRWCYYCLNLLGDPAMDGWTSAPSALPVAHSAETGRDDLFVYAETDIPGALASLYDGSDCVGTYISDEAGRLIIPTGGPLGAEIDSLILTVTAHDRLMYRSTIAVVETTPSVTTPSPLTLGQNQPNPFNPVTMISFTLPASGRVSLTVYDAAGRLVGTILDREMEAGPHSMPWQPETLSSGVYFYILRTPDAKISRKAVLLR
ncbi:MAG: T9SS type A sorting domain-containing protein [Candidatus Krumholzibacteria bacterium]|nr:T9SS type A sorting domain-containing protein [Candidatus Krumholzibacteria bacterium]